MRLKGLNHSRKNARRAFREDKALRAIFEFCGFPQVKVRLLSLYVLTASASLSALPYSDGSSVINLLSTADATYGGKVSALLSKIADRYQLSSLDSVTKGASTAQSLATMGAGSTYATGNYTLLVGGGAGVAANGVDQSLTDIANKLSDIGGDTLPKFGIGAQVSALVGLNLGTLRTPRYLGPLELNRMTVLANFFSISSNAVSGLAASATVAGLHAQYQLRRPARFGWLMYGEFLLTTGFDYSRLALAYDSTTGAKAMTPVTVGSGTAADPQLTWSPGGTIALASGSGTIPVELSTSVRLLYFLSLYVGGGADFNIGKASTDINLSGTVSGSNGGASSNIGTGSLTVSKSATPQFASGRGFAGIQINLIPGRTGNILGLFVQASATSIGGFAVQTGLRMAW